jgi:Ner family transcriptional regulator
MYKAKAPLNMAKKPASQDWERWRIIGAVRATGTTLRQLSIKHGLGPSVLRNCLYNPAPKYERLVAEHIGTSPQAIWPTRYNDDGSPKSGRGERGLGRYVPKQGNGSTTEKSRNVYNINNQEAA